MVQASQVLQLCPGYRLGLQQTELAWLHGPHETVALSGLASLILQALDGQRSVRIIATELAPLFGEPPGMLEDVLLFLEAAQARHWVC